MLRRCVHPFMIVTVSNEYGAGALAIAKRAADELGYEYVDRQLPVVVAKRLRISPEDVEANEDAQRSLGERWLTSLERATPELAQSSSVEPFDEELLKAVQEAVREFARRGNAVIVGRAAGLVLGPAANVVRVFLHAPREWRIAHIVDTFGSDRKTAEFEVERIDRMRAAYVRSWYAAEFGDHSNYDLCIDTSRFDRAQCAELIVSAVRIRAAR